LITVSPGSQFAAALKLVMARADTDKRVRGLNIIILLVESHPITLCPVGIHGKDGM
jgi:hypothetical protein